MSEDVRRWLRYSEENLRAARACLRDQVLNPCIYESQQSVEKSLKCILVFHDLEVIRTHKLKELHNILLRNGIQSGIDIKSLDLLDSVFVPVRYPLGSRLPDFNADVPTCESCIALAELALARARVLCGFLEQC